MEERTYTVRITRDDDSSFFAEVLELPGCIASGDSADELRESLTEALSLYLSSDVVMASVLQLPLNQLPLFDSGDRAVPAQVNLALV